MASDCGTLAVHSAWWYPRRAIASMPVAASAVGSNARRHELTSLQVTPFVGGGERGSLCIYRGETPGLEPRVIAAAAHWGLTARQSEVLALLARGHTNARIASELGCAEGTVEIHVSRILDRAQVESRAALIAALLWGRSG